MFMCNKLKLNFTFTENKSTFLVLVYSVPYPDSLQFFKDKTRKKDLTLAHIYGSLIHGTWSDISCDINV